MNGTPTGTTHWIEGTQTVMVNDGKLTLSQGAGSYNTKICFIDIAPAGQFSANLTPSLMQSLNLPRIQNANANRRKESSPN